MLFAYLLALTLAKPDFGFTVPAGWKEAKAYGPTQLLITRGQAQIAVTFQEGFPATQLAEILLDEPGRTPGTNLPATLGGRPARLVQYTRPKAFERAYLTDQRAGTLMLELLIAGRETATPAELRDLEAVRASFRFTR